MRHYTPLEESSSPTPAAPILEAWITRLSTAGATTWRRTFTRDAAAASLTGVYVGVLGPFLGLVAAKTLHAPVALISLMMAAPFVGSLLTPLWVHHLHGRPKLPFVIVPGLVARLAYLLMAVVHSAWAYVGVVFIAQLLETSGAPGYSAVMERVYPQRLRGRLMSYVRVVRSLVVIGITLAAGHVLDTWGYHHVFVAAAMFGMAGTLLFGTIRVPSELDDYERTQPAASPGAAWRIFKSDAQYRQFAIAVFIYGAGNLLLNPIYPLFADRVLHITYAQQGQLVSAGAIVQVLAFLGWGHFIDRYGSVRCVFTCIAIIAIKPFIYLMAKSYGWLLPAAMLDGVSNAGIEIGYINCILAFSPAEQVPAYQSLHATLLGVRGIAAPFCAWLLVTVLQRYHLGYRPAFLVSGAMILTALWLGRSVRCDALPREG